MLDTGARLSVVRQLDLDRLVINDPGRVFGLCDNPIKVLGYIDVEIRVGTHQSVRERLQVLGFNSPTLILGPAFMGQFNEIAFDFKLGRIKLGGKWEPVQATVSGSNPLTRTRYSRCAKISITPNSSTRS